MILNMADDLRLAWVGINGGTPHKTPNLDMMAVRKNDRDTWPSAEILA